MEVNARIEIKRRLGDDRHSYSGDTINGRHDLILVFLFPFFI